MTSISHSSSFSDAKAYLSQPNVSKELAFLYILQKHYPRSTVTVTPEATNFRSFAEAGQAQATLDTTSGAFAAWRVYAPPTGRSSAEPGKFSDERVQFGKYDYTWNELSFIIYEATFMNEYHRFESESTFYFIIYETDDPPWQNGRPKAVDDLIAAATQYSSDVHNEILVFDQEAWSKNRDLWNSVQGSFWDDVILDDSLKSSLVTEVESFFDSRADYEKFAVPWKRGIIFHGLPGNGKTISVKALIRNLSSRPDPIPTLYVKSLAGCHGPHYSIREIFVKAREQSPCLLVFEDIDSLVTDKVKSFFLNEVDGLESNNGIMMIGSTNYLERLDAGISKRPSRFDRKYHFALPANKERIQYCDYWKNKLASNDSISFPPALSSAIAEITEGFSFAYLKEIFITALLKIVALQGIHGKEEANGISEIEIQEHKDDDYDVDDRVKSTLLWQVISKEVKTLRIEMEEGRKSAEQAAQNNAAPADVSYSSSCCSS